MGGLITGAERAFNGKHGDDWGCGGKGSCPSTEASVGTFVVADVVPGWGRPSNDVRLDDPDVGSAGQRRGWKPPPLRKSRLRLSHNSLRLRQCGNLSRSRRPLRI